MITINAKVFDGSDLKNITINVTNVCNGGVSVGIYAEGFGEGFMSCETFARVQLCDNILLFAEKRDMNICHNKHNVLFISELKPVYKTNRRTF